MPFTRIEREKLYEQVWSRPMNHLAREYGVSSQRLKELCDQAGIPTPAPGHWARIAAGKIVPQLALPEVSSDSSWVTISPSPSRRKKPALASRSEVADKKEKPAETSRAEPSGILSKSAPNLAVPAKLGRPHRIIAGWLAEHKRSKEEAKQYSWIHFSPTPYSAMDRRRHRILDTLFKAIEKVGGKAVEEERKALAIELEGERIPFQLREKQKQVRRPLTESERRWHRAGDKEWRQELQPSGKLIFEIKHYLPSGFKLQWLETDEMPMEEFLPEIFDTLKRAAPILAQRTRERLEQQRLAEIAAHERYLAEQARKRDDNRWQGFLELAATWQRHEQARLFLEALKQREFDPDCMVGEVSLAEWLTWVEHRLEAGNPLNQGVEVLFGGIEKVTSYTYSN